MTKKEVSLSDWIVETEDFYHNSNVILVCKIKEAVKKLKEEIEPFKNSRWARSMLVEIDAIFGDKLI